MQTPRGYNAFCYPGSCYIPMCTSPRPFPLNGTSGNGACRRNHGDAAVVSRSTAYPTSTAPHDWCAWREVNGFSTARPKKRLGGRRARSSLYYTAPRSSVSDPANNYSSPLPNGWKGSRYPRCAHSAKGCIRDMAIPGARGRVSAAA